MKIGIISDPHANLYGLQAVLNELKDADMILCAGDLTGYYTFVNETLDLLREKGVICILGNHDAYIVGLLAVPSNPVILPSLEYTKNHISKENLDYLKSLKAGFLEVAIDRLRVRMYHASPWDEFEEYVFPDYKNFERFREIQADVIILGHTHYPMIHWEGEKLVINPGSCGQPRDYNPQASFAIFDTTTRKAVIKRITYNSEEIRKRAYEESLDPYVIQVLTRTECGKTL
ncbi:MAG: YfcE family phosphodiesterase [Candidatus Wildermuthbacteria bacterium]|nr:YfcE family phosphodiesterase [Candidatus Wildermuthbacteria bacterium]